MAVEMVRNAKDPGFSAANYFTQWEPAVRRLIELKMTTICTGYSHKDHFTYDAPMDERILYSYFLANIIIGTTFNPAFLSDPSGRCEAHKNRVYLAFKGPRTASSLSPPEIISNHCWVPIVALTKQQLHAVNQVEFIKSIAFIGTQYEHNPSLTARCNKVLKALAEGKKPFDPS
eukprot:gene33919-41838_t